MKILISLSFLIFPFLLNAQDHFLPVTDKDHFPDGFGTDLHQVYQDPSGYDDLTFFADELDSITHYDLSRLTNLEVIVIKYSFDPGKGDTARVPFVKKTHEELMLLEAFGKCPKLKTIVFSIGEQIYLSDIEKKNLELNGDKEYPERIYKKKVQQNLQNAWIDFGSALQQKLPGIKLYAYDWGW